jgi:hypothetical protein
MKKLILIALVFLSGCATQNVQKDYVLDNSSNTGLVIGSISKINHLIWPPSYNFSNLNGQHKGILKFEQDFFNKLISDFPNAHAKLFVFELPAGEYKISRWAISQGYIGLESNDGFDIRFNVNKSQITYIGDLEMTTTSGGLFGEGIGGMTFKVIDNSNRDIKLAKDRYLNLDYENLNKDLMVIKNTGFEKN